MRLNLDFTASPGSHFGPVKSIEEEVDAISNVIDYWVSTPASVALLDGKVSAWTGKHGRRFVQDTAARRPEYDVDGLRMFDPSTGAATGIMSLADAQFGAMPTLTLAAKVKLTQAALTVDGHYLWAGSSPVLRTMYRYIAGNNFLRAQITSATNSADIDLKPDQVNIGVLLVGNGLDFDLYLAGGGHVGNVSASGASFSNLFLGSANGTVPALPGWFQKFGAWRKQVTASERESLLRWLS